jgi:hypothetical protein
VLEIQAWDINQKKIKRHPIKEEENLSLFKNCVITACRKD